MAIKIISAKAARAQGLTNYFTGKPCKNGHIAERNALNHTCLECLRSYTDPIADRERVRGWRAANREYVRKRDRKYRAENVEAARAREHKWRKRHGARARLIKLVIQQNHYARELGAEGSHTVEEVIALLKKQRYRCTYCSANLRKIKRHLDHIIPMKRGGSNWITNQQWLCSTCNRRKSDKLPGELWTVKSKRRTKHG